MYLTAHRVVSLSRGEGVNAYCHLHGAFTWPGPPPQGVPDADPGTLVNEHTQLPPPGNRVRAYLDIIAPDETPTDEVIGAAREFLAISVGHPVPWVETVGRCTFRFNLDAELVARWAAVFAELFQAALGVRRAA